MGTDVAKFDKDGKLVNAAGLADRYRQGKSVAPAGSGQGPFIGIKKNTEDWVYGQANDPCHPDSLWAVNAIDIKVGWVNWCDGKKAGEEMASIFDDPITEDMLPEAKIVEKDPKKRGEPSDWNPQYTMTFSCVHGPNKGAQPVWNASSVSGRREAEKLVDMIAARVETDDKAFFPIIKLGTDSYVHEVWGEVTTPELEAVAWGTHDGKITEGIGDTDIKALAAPKPAAKKTVTRRRRRAA